MHTYMLHSPARTCVWLGLWLARMCMVARDCRASDASGQIAAMLQHEATLMQKQKAIHLELDQARTHACTHARLHARTHAHSHGCSDVLEAGRVFVCDA